MAIIRDSELAFGKVFALRPMHKSQIRILEDIAMQELTEEEAEVFRMKYSWGCLFLAVNPELEKKINDPKIPAPIRKILASMTVAKMREYILNQYERAGGDRELVSVTVSVMPGGRR